LDLSLFESFWPFGASKIFFVSYPDIFSTLATSKSMIKTIRNIQRNFLWKGSKEGQKWALVNWGGLYKLK